MYLSAELGAWVATTRFSTSHVTDIFGCPEVFVEGLLLAVYDGALPTVGVFEVRLPNPS